MKYCILLILLIQFSACSNRSGENQADLTDTLEKKEMQSVDEMLKNEDSLMKAKEKELLEKYGR